MEIPLLLTPVCSGGAELRLQPYWFNTILPGEQVLREYIVPGLVESAPARRRAAEKAALIEDAQSTRSVRLQASICRQSKWDTLKAGLQLGVMSVEDELASAMHRLTHHLRASPCSCSTSAGCQAAEGAGGAGRGAGSSQAAAGSACADE